MSRLRKFDVRFCFDTVLRSAKMEVHGLVKFDVPYLFYLALPGKCLVEYEYFLAND